MGTGNRKWEMGNQGGKLWHHMIFHGLIRALAVFKSCNITTFFSVRITHFPFVYEKLSNKRPFWYFHFIYKYNSTRHFFNTFLAFFLARWYNSLKKHITNEGKINLRLRRISRKKVSTVYYVFTRAMTTTHTETKLGGKGQDLFFGNVRKKRSRPIGQNIRHKR